MNPFQHSFNCALGALCVIGLSCVAASMGAAQEIAIRSYLISYPEMDLGAPLPALARSDKGAPIVGKPSATDDKGIGYWSMSVKPDTSKLFLTVTYELEAAVDGYEVEPVQFRIWKLDELSPYPVGVLISKTGTVSSDEALHDENGWLRQRLAWKQTNFNDAMTYYLRARLAAQHVLSVAPNATANKDYYLAMYLFLQATAAVNREAIVVDPLSDDAVSWMIAYVQRVEAKDKAFVRQMSTTLKQANDALGMASNLTKSTYTKIYDAVSCTDPKTCSVTASSCRVLKRLQTHFQKDIVKPDMENINSSGGLVAKIVLGQSQCIGIALGSGGTTALDPAFVDAASEAELATLASQQLQAIDWISSATKDEQLKAQLKIRRGELAQYAPGS